MKKTVSVNIKGMNFLIEEDAFELLQDYMNRLSHGLRNEKDSKEIIEDIELRIAELCTSRLSNKKQVIEIEDIQFILDTLGDPSQYLDNDESSSQSFNESDEQKTYQHERERHLFRDLENASIAGVCAGIANYFKIDVVIIRAIFLIMFIFGGFGFPLYVILWIVVPKAKSTIEKLRMRGKPITVDSVKEEVENAAKRFETQTKSFANRIRREDHLSHRFSSLGKVIGAVVGVFLIIQGLFFLVMFMIFGVVGVRVIPVQSDSGYLSLHELAKMTIETQSDYNWGYAGVIVTALSISFFLLLLGIKLVFRIRNRWSRLSLISLFITGFIGSTMVLIIGLKTGREISIEGELEHEIGTYYGDELTIIPHLSTYESSNNKFKIKTDVEWGMMTIKGDKISEPGIHIHYKPSSDSLFHVYQTLSAHSHSHKIALEKAKNIRHSMSIDSNIVNLNNYYTYPIADKMRLQQVEIYIEIPADKTVKINNEIIRLGPDPFKDKNVDENYEENGRIESNGSYSHWN
jgi:phage shock protein PspC (stress-responsive transcriptional regulator)